MAANKLKFVDNSDKVKKSLREVELMALEKMGLQVVGSAKKLARKRDNHMANNINHDVNESNLTVRVGSPDDYAIYNEFGTGEFAENGSGRKGGWSYKTPDGKWHHTKGMKPKPFLRPAFRLNKKNIQAILKDDLGRKFK
ncbi:HK97-gp10 family putative phage morphogenesis protein [Erysipelothrix anatis]|uniref:HK97-gp10 family putative phage morphogenesis protein n=1 Tax=Erysipelothrix anatis TaxID=2683713 RepID=UPI001409A5A7|nr:HK97-gp10 family putative phage morphogenesis protein [Erysipelothrix anatis]